MSELLRTKSSPAEILEKYAKTVYRLAYSHTGNRQDAEDVMQEVFLAYIRTSPVFRDENHEKAWFLKVAMNKSSSLMTSSWSKSRAELDENTAASDEKEPQSVLDAVMGLKPKYRTVIELFYYEDMSVKSIADITNQSVGTVKTQLSRAREMLKDVLTEDEFDV